MQILLARSDGVVVACGMRYYSVPCGLQGLVLDIDKTLYTHDGYARSQIDVLVERLSRERGEPLARTARLVGETQRELGRGSRGTQSLGNTFAALGIPIEESVRWRNELIRPQEYLVPDERLRVTLTELAGRYRLIVVTNNPEAVGRRTLAALGVDDLLPLLIGLDTTGRSKPDPAAFVLAAELLGLLPQTMCSVGDRYDVDIAPALSVGMGGVLVDGVEEVYDLPSVLAGGRA